MSSQFLRFTFTSASSNTFKLFPLKNSLVLEKGLLPKKPWLTENGDGWDELILQMKKGQHEESKRIEKIVTNKLTIKSPIKFKCNIDGEVLEDDYFQIELVKEGITIYYNEDMIQKLSI